MLKITLTEYLYNQAQQRDNPAPANADVGELLSSGKCVGDQQITGYLVPGFTGEGLDGSAVQPALNNW